VNTKDFFPTCHGYFHVHSIVRFFYLDQIKKICWIYIWIDIYCLYCTSCKHGECMFAYDDDDKKEIFAGEDRNLKCLL